MTEKPQTVAIRLNPNEEALYRSGVHAGRAQAADALLASLEPVVIRLEQENGAAWIAEAIARAVASAREAADANRREAMTWLGRAVERGVGGRTLRTRVRGAIMGAIGGWKGAP